MTPLAALIIRLCPPWFRFSVALCADADRIQFSLRECGRDFGISGWGGTTSHRVAEALQRIARTTIDGVALGAAGAERCPTHLVAPWPSQVRWNPIAGG